MLRLSRLLSAIRHRDWFTTVDLRDAYFCIPIHKDHRKYVCFFFHGRAYEYAVLPFGLNHLWMLPLPSTLLPCEWPIMHPLSLQLTVCPQTSLPRGQEMEGENLTIAVL